jgi:hypothetical protein
MSQDSKSRSANWLNSLHDVCAFISQDACTTRVDKLVNIINSILIFTYYLKHIYNESYDGVMLDTSCIHEGSDHVLG